LFYHLLNLNKVCHLDQSFSNIRYDSNKKYAAIDIGQMLRLLLSILWNKTEKNRNLIKALVRVPSVWGKMLLTV
jgi:hypothetical protein